MARVTRAIALLSVGITYLLRRNYGYSWWWAIPLYFSMFVEFHMVRMLVYERYLSPLAKLPGPKVPRIFRVVIDVGTLVCGRIPRY